jgi:hypothetical protein
VLTLRKEQMAVFEQEALTRFVETTLARVGVEFPDRLEALGDEPARALIRDGVHRAAAFGIEGRVDVGLFVDLLFGIDPDFERLEAWQWARAILESEEIDAQIKLERVYTELARAHADPEPGTPADGKTEDHA